MPAREIPLVTDQVYHIFNKIEHNESLFTQKTICQPMIDALWYYQYCHIPMKLSYFRNQSIADRASIAKTLDGEKCYVDILTYCLMPNHFHLILRQKEINGISIYMSKVQNSITKFANIKRKTKGHVFIGQFKAKRIDSDELLLHISRYIHLNPYTGYVRKTFDDTTHYPWSSFHEYISDSTPICKQTSILSHFKSKEEYMLFVNNQKEYQRTLADIRHALIEDID
ncbi:transposase [Candidatus Gottesmanbacteria bacterium]|nr:transposase [Candidatus Gottesmanbacteria bacterium]